DQGQMMVEIARDVYLAMNISGLEAFNTRPENSKDQRALIEKAGLQPASYHVKEMRNNTETGNVNLFSQLSDLRISLLTGDTDGVRDTLERFDDLHSHLVSVRSKIGSRMNGIQNTYQTLERHDVTNAQLGSYIE